MYFNNELLTANVPSSKKGPSRSRKPSRGGSRGGSGGLMANKEYLPGEHVVTIYGLDEKDMGVNFVARFVKGWAIKEGVLFMDYETHQVFGRSPNKSTNEDWAKALVDTIMKAPQPSGYCKK